MANEKILPSKDTLQNGEDHDANLIRANDEYNRDSIWVDSVTPIGPNVHDGMLWVDKSLDPWVVKVRKNGTFERVGIILRDQIEMLRPHEQSTPNLTVYVRAGKFISSDATKNLTFAGGSSPAMVAPAGNPRIDLLTINDLGNLQITTGVEDASPTVPLYPSGAMVLAEIYLTVAITQIFDANITDVRPFLNTGGSGGGTASATEYRESYIVGTPKDNYSGSTTVFDLVDTYVANGSNLRVYYDGVLMRPGGSYDYVETDTDTITFNSARLAGSTVECVWEVGQALIIGAQGLRENFVASASQTIFNLSNTYQLGGLSLHVYIDGVLMTITDDYTETNNTRVTFVTPMTGGQKVSFVWGDAEITNTDKVDNIHASTTPEADKLLALDTNSTFPMSVLRNLMQRNMLTNGGLEIWQRGNIFNGIAANSFAADYWKILHDATTINVTRESGVSNYSYKAIVTGVGAGTYIQVGQDIEANNTLELRSMTLSLSSYVKANVASRARVFIWDNISGYSFSGYHTGGGAWELLTRTATINASATSIVIGVRFDGGLANANELWFDNVMLIVGDDAVDYIPMNPAEDIQRCERYYEKGRFHENNVPIYRTGGVNYVYDSVNFRTLKRSTPTMTGAISVVTLGHQPTTGNGGSTDTGNWNVPGFFWQSIYGARLGISRTSDQTTYPIVLMHIDWIAEIT